MPLALSLSDIEKGQIIAYHDSGMSNRAIAKKLGRSHMLSIVSSKIQIDMEQKNVLDVLSPRNKRKFLRMLLIRWILVAKSAGISNWMSHLKLLEGQ